MNEQQQKQPTQTATPTATTPAQTVPAPTKEQEPGGGVVGEIAIEEAPSEHKELAPKKELGEVVQPIPTKPEIPPAVERSGAVQHTGPTTPIPQQPSPTITLPLSDEEIVRGLHAHVWQSIRWLAVWCVRKLQKARIRVKELHGKLIRSSS